MKKLLTFLCLLLVGNVFAQSLAPFQKQITIEKINVDSWAASIDKGTEDDLKDAFSEYVSKNYKLKTKKNGKHGVIVPEANISQITTRRGDLHIQFSNDTGKPEMAMAFMMGYDIFLNSRDSPQEMDRFKEFFSNFLLEYYKSFYTKQLSEKEKTIKNLREQMVSNEKKSKNLQQDIERNQKKISREKDQLKKVAIENKNVAARRQIDALAEMNGNINTQVSNYETEIAEIKMQVANIGK